LATEDLLQEPNKTITIGGTNVTVALEGRGKALTQGMVLKWSFSVPTFIVAAELVDFEDGSDSAQLTCSKLSRQRSALFLNATISENAFDWRNWTKAGFNDFVLEAHTPFGVDAIVVEPAMADVPQSSAVVQLDADAEGLEPWAEGVIIATVLLLVLAGVAVGIWLVLKRRREHSDSATASTSVEAETLPRVAQAQPTGQYGAFPQGGEAQSVHYDHVMPISSVQYDQLQPELVASQYQSIRPIQPRYENPRTAT
jgi:hypothetical protein